MDRRKDSDRDLYLLLCAISHGYQPCESEKHLINTCTSFIVEDSDISFLPDSICLLESLRTLSISYSKITKVPNSLLQLRNLTKLEANHSELVELPNNIDKLVLLEELSICDSKISVIPDEIGNLFFLQRLLLNHTQVSSLPNSVGRLQSLQVLDISSTKISILPNELSKLWELRHLDISNTPIVSLPDGLINLRQLSFISLENTQIKSLPDSFLRRDIPVYCDVSDPKKEKGIYISSVVTVPSAETAACSGEEAKHEGVLMKPVEMEITKKVFISYSWDSPEHKNWVLQLSEKLSNNPSIQTIVDQKDLVPGDLISLFMEQSITNSDFVIFVCTPKYKEKADLRKGGGGYENTIITSELIRQNNQRKFIPVLAYGSWESSLPIWASGKMGVDMSSHEKFEAGILELISAIVGK